MAPPKPSKLLSVNVSLPKEVTYKGKVVTTGIFKEPVEGKIKAGKLNLEGDGQADLVGHGGEMRAVYVYSHANYASWEKELGRGPFPMGQFGENFTVEDMPDDDIHVGDRFRIGTALFEVSQARVPCYKLAMKMEDEGFYAKILKSGKLGFYFRVIQEGHVEAGDDIVLEYSHPSAMNIVEANNLMYFDKENFEGFRRALEIEAFSPGWRITFEDRLAKEGQSKKARAAYKELSVTRKVVESDVITSFYLKDPDGHALPPHLPGQYLPIKLDIPGQYETVDRTYSISNGPNGEYYRLTIKREDAPKDVPNAYPGVSSNYFHKTVEEGTRILASAPRGKFFFHPSGRPVVLLSAGVGLTPLLAMLEKIVVDGYSAPVWFVHGARNGASHAMANHVRELVKDRQELHTFFKYSRPLTSDKLGEDFDAEGRVAVSDLQRFVDDISAADFYVCGPANFMKGTLKDLMDAGANPTQIYYEFFGSAGDAGSLQFLTEAKRQNSTNSCCAEVEVHFRQSGKVSHWNPSFDSLLEFAESEGLSPSFSCRSGVCQTCACRLEEGAVEYDPEPLVEPSEGYVLICCSKPSGSIQLDL